MPIRQLFFCGFSVVWVGLFNRFFDMSLELIESFEKDYGPITRRPTELHINFQGQETPIESAVQERGRRPALRSVGAYSFTAANGKGPTPANIADAVRMETSGALNAIIHSFQKMPKDGQEAVYRLLLVQGQPSANFSSIYLGLVEEYPLLNYFLFDPKSGFLKPGMQIPTAGLTGEILHVEMSGDVPILNLYIAETGETQPILFQSALRMIAPILQEMIF